MTAVYRLRPDLAPYARFIPRDSVGFRARYPHAFSGKNMAVGDDLVRCTVDDLSKPLGDFGAFEPGSLVVMHDVAHASSRYEMSGQLIPVSIHERQAYALNVTKVLNALDAHSSDPALDRLIFLPKRLGGTSLFKIPETAERDIYTHTGITAAYDDFVAEYQRNGFCGLEFELVWADDEHGTSQSP